MKKDIDKLKFACGFVVNYAESLVNKLDDKKLSWGERISLIVELKPMTDIVKDWRETKEEILDLDEDERKELVTFCQQEFDLSNEKAEIIAEKAINVVLSIFEMISVFN